MSLFNIKKLYKEDNLHIDSLLEEKFKRFQKLLKKKSLLPVKGNVISIPYTHFVPFDEQIICDQILDIFSSLECIPDSQHRLIKINLQGSYKTAEKTKALTQTFQLILLHNHLKEIQHTTLKELYKKKDEQHDTQTHIHSTQREEQLLKKSYKKIFVSMFSIVMYSGIIFFALLHLFVSKLELPFIENSLLIIDGGIVVFILVFIIQFISKLFSIHNEKKSHNQTLASYHSSHGNIAKEIEDTIFGLNTIIEKHQREVNKNSNKLQTLFQYQSIKPIESLKKHLHVDMVTTSNI